MKSLRRRVVPILLIPKGKWGGGKFALPKNYYIYLEKCPPKLPLKRFTFSKMKWKEGLGSKKQKENKFKKNVFRFSYSYRLDKKKTFIEYDDFSYCRWKPQMNNCHDQCQFFRLAWENIFFRNTLIQVVDLFKKSGSSLQ